MIHKLKIFHCPHKYNPYLNQIIYKNLTTSTTYISHKFRSNPQGEPLFPNSPSLPIPCLAFPYHHQPTNHTTNTRASKKANQNTKMRKRKKSINQLTRLGSIATTTLNQTPTNHQTLHTLHFQVQKTPLDAKDHRYPSTHRLMPSERRREKNKRKSRKCP